MAGALTLAELLAAFCGGLFAGAAVYITLAEHPARMERGVELAATVFPGSYRRAAAMQAPLAGLGCAAALAAWLGGAGREWLAGGLLLGAVIPLTVVVIAPTNKRLLDPVLDRRSGEAWELLSRWGRLHAVRSVLSTVALVLFLYGLGVG
jgi:hypothetical protein